MPEPRSGGHRSLSRRAVLASAAVGLGTALTPALSACSAASGSTSGGVTLTFAWWGNDDRAARTEQAVRLFEKEHPGVTVQTSNADFTSYLQKLATQAAGGGVPDVVQLDYRQISQYASGKALLPLGDAIRDGRIRTAELDKALLRTGVIEDTQYALPMGRGICGYAYDSALYKKLGIPTPTPDYTWDDWADINRTISAANLKSPDGRHVAGANDGGTNEDVFEDWIRGRGKQLYSSRTRLGYDEDDLTAFWTYFDTLRRQGAVAAARDTTQANSAETSPIGRGLAAADFNWDATFPGIPALLGDGIHFAPVPSTRGRAGQYFKPSMLIGVGAHTRHPREAAALLDFLVNDVRAGDAMGFTRSTPPNRTIAARVAKTLKGPEREIYEYAQVMEKYGVSDPPFAPPKGDVAIQAAFKRNYGRVMYELTTPRKAAREFIAEAYRELRS